MFFIELHGDFGSEEDVLEAIHGLVERLEFDPETGEIVGLLPEPEEIVVEVPDHIIEWAKNSPMSDDIVAQAD